MILWLLGLSVRYDKWFVECDLLLASLDVNVSYIGLVFVGDEIKGRRQNYYILKTMPGLFQP